MKTTPICSALFALGLLAAGAACADTGKVTGVSVPGITVAANGILPVTALGTGKCAYKMAFSDGVHNYPVNAEFITPMPAASPINLGLAVPGGMVPGNYTVALTIFPAYQFPCGSGTFYSGAFKVVAAPPPPPPPPGPPGKLFGTVMFDKPVAKLGDTVKVTVMGEGACAFEISDDGAHGPARSNANAGSLVRTLPFNYEITPPKAGNFKFLAKADGDAPAAQRCAGTSTSYLQVLEDNKRPDLRVTKGAAREKDEVNITVEDSVYKMENHERYYGYDWVVTNVGQADSTPSSIQVTCALTEAGSPRTICLDPTRSANIPALKPGQSHTVQFSSSDFRWHHSVRKTWDTAIPNSGQQTEHHDTGLVSDHPSYHGSVKAALRNISGIYITDLADNDSANNASSVSLNHN